MMDFANQFEFTALKSKVPRYVLYFYQSYHLYQFKTHFIAIAKKKSLAS